MALAKIDHAPQRPLQSVKAGLAYFALVFGAGFAMGAVRVPFLVPRLGARVAELIEMPVMFVVILVSARFVAKRFALSRAFGTRLSAGLLALLLLVCAELALAVALQGRSIAQYIASREPVSGGVYLVMLVLFALMPLLLARAPESRAPTRKSSREPFHRTLGSGVNHWHPQARWQVDRPRRSPSRSR